MPSIFRIMSCFIEDYCFENCTIQLQSPIIVRVLHRLTKSSKLKEKRRNSSERIKKASYKLIMFLYFILVSIKSVKDVFFICFILDFSPKTAVPASGFQFATLFPIFWNVVKLKLSSYFAFPFPCTFSMVSFNSDSQNKFIPGKVFLLLRFIVSSQYSFLWKPGQRRRFFRRRDVSIVLVSSSLTRFNGFYTEPQTSTNFLGNKNLPQHVFF